MKNKILGTNLKSTGDPLQDAAKILFCYVYGPGFLLSIAGAVIWAVLF